LFSYSDAESDLTLNYDVDAAAAHHILQLRIFHLGIFAGGS
jgi:hypothetical protein